jgi:hypothetical protein
MAANPAQLTRMSDADTKAVRALMDTHRWRDVAQMLGIFAEATLWKVCAGAVVSRLTASTIREHLAAMEGGE